MLLHRAAHERLRHQKFSSEAIRLSLTAPEPSFVAPRGRCEVVGGAVQEDVPDLVGEGEAPSQFRLRGVVIDHPSRRRTLSGVGHCNKKRLFSLTIAF